MFMSDTNLDKLIDKFIKEMEKSTKERETYLIDIEDNDFIFKEIGGK